MDFFSFYHLIIELLRTENNKSIRLKGPPNDLFIRLFLPLLCTGGILGRSSFIDNTQDKELTRNLETVSRLVLSKGNMPRLKKIGGSYLRNTTC